MSGSTDNITCSPRRLKRKNHSVIETTSLDYTSSEAETKRSPHQATPRSAASSPAKKAPSTGKGASSSPTKTATTTHQSKSPTKPIARSPKKPSKSPLKTAKTVNIKSPPATAVKNVKNIPNTKTASKANPKTNTAHKPDTSKRK